MARLIGRQDRRAVRHLNHDDTVRRVRYRDVGFGSAASLRGRDMHRGAVDLRQSHDALGGQPNRLPNGVPAGALDVSGPAQRQLPGGPAVPHLAERAAPQGQAPWRRRPFKLPTHLWRHVTRIVKYRS